MEARLPLELVDSILKDCGPEILQACSLVCKSWLPLCRSRLFGIVAIDMERSNSQERCRQLVMMEAVAPYIRRLALRFHLLEEIEENSDEESAGKSKENDHTISLDLMVRGLSQLKGRLKTLHALTIVSTYGSFLLCNESLVEFLKPLRRYHTLSPLLSTFADIVELNLSLEHEDLESFLTFICSFPWLRVLRVHIYGFATFRQRPLPTCVLPLTLRSFYLNADDGDRGSNLRFHQWVSTHPPRQIVLFSITDFYDQSSGFSPPVEPYFTGLCKETKSLHLSFDLDDINIEAPSVPHNLNLLKSLERIVFSLHGIGTDSLEHVAPIILPKLLQMLTTISSPHLRTVIFHLMGNSSRKVLSMLNLRDEWNRIDDLLSTEKFATCVTELVVPYSTSEHDLITSGWNAFPKVNHTRRLSIIRAPFRTKDVLGPVGYESGVEEEIVQEEMEWVCNRQY